MTTPHIVQLAPNDNVVIATESIPPGQSVSVGERTVVTATAIPRGHKLAVRTIEPDTPILKYGCPIGLATQTIEPGHHVHIHNVRDQHDISDDFSNVSPPPRPPAKSKTFRGFHRPNGTVGTRNYVAVLSTVNCSATVCHKVVERFDSERLKRWPNVDGVFAAAHTTGCAMQYHGIKHQMLGRTMAGMAHHPNVGACLMIGLGCEQNTAGYLTEHHGVVSLYAPGGQKLTRDNGVPILTMQSEGGTRVTIEKAEQLVEQLLDKANESQREESDACHLMLAVECGGSDGYSGITANPAVGNVADRLVACGGTVILSETTELYGAEHLLVQRSRDEAVARKLIEKIQWWKEYVAHYGGEIDNNPSVGNKAGGLTTITEKSLGAVSKSGSTALEAVYEYAAKVQAKGLVVMDSPGFDPASVTGKVAGGANLVMFTTGRGSCFGCKPAPVIKIASNSTLFETMREDMDLNAGVLIGGGELSDVGKSFFDYALRVASGEQTASEKLGFGDHEFVPWTVGPTV